VQAFLAGRLDFPGIPRVVEKVLERHRPVPATSLASVQEADAWARGVAEEMVSRGGEC